MLTALDLTTIESGSCGGCGRPHRFRIATVDDDSSPPRPLCGFFERCPATGRRTWYVIALASPVGRLVKIGPPDDECWVPDLELEPAWATAGDDSEIDSPMPDLHPSVPPRGRAESGFRARSPGSDRLRRALGCPHTK